MILILHHRSKGSSSLDWSERAAGTYAISAATEGEIHVVHFAEWPTTASERLVEIRARRFSGVELAIPFWAKSLDYERVLERPAAPLYADVVQLRAALGDRSFSPKQLTQELGLLGRSVCRIIGRLEAVGLLSRHGYGRYLLRGGF